MRVDNQVSGWVIVHGEAVGVQVQSRCVRW
jgi:hypothetical protein